MVTTVGLAPLLLPDLSNIHIEAGKERPLEYTQILNVEDLAWQGEKSLQLATLGTMPAKPQGTPFASSEPILGSTKTYEASPFGMAFEVSWEMYRDDLYGAIVEIIQSMARSGRYREEVAAHEVLNQAFNTSFVGFKAGEALVQRSHTLLDGSTAHNTPAVSEAFSITYLQGMIQRFHAMTTHRDGMPRLMTPVTAVIAPQYLFTAREILSSSLKPFTANNEINSLIEEDMNYMVSHYLTNPNHHFVVAQRGEHDLNFKWRDRPMFDMYDDLRLKAAVATHYQRHTNGTFGDWEGIDGSGN